MRLSSSHYEMIPVIAPNNTFYLPDVSPTQGTPNGSIFRKLESDLPAQVPQARLPPLTCALLNLNAPPSPPRCMPCQSKHQFQKFSNSNSE